MHSQASGRGEVLNQAGAVAADDGGGRQVVFGDQLESDRADPVGTDGDHAVNTGFHIVQTKAAVVLSRDPRDLGAFPEDEDVRHCRPFENIGFGTGGVDHTAESTVGLGDLEQVIADDAGPQSGQIGFLDRMTDRLERRRQVTHHGTLHDRLIDVGQRNQRLDGQIASGFDVRTDHVHRTAGERGLTAGGQAVDPGRDAGDGKFAVDVARRIESLAAVLLDGHFDAIDPQSAAVQRGRHQPTVQGPVLGQTDPLVNRQLLPQFGGSRRPGANQGDRSEKQGKSVFHGGASREEFRGCENQRRLDWSGILGRWRNFAGHRRCLDNPLQQLPNRLFLNFLFCGLWELPGSPVRVQGDAKKPCP